VVENGLFEVKIDLVSEILMEDLFGVGLVG
jgi:hypothetical protein